MGKSDEVLEICNALIESTKEDDVKYDALRIMAETYKSKGEYELVRVTLNRIPEIYFTKLQLDTLLLDGREKFEAAERQKGISFEILLDMLLELAKYYGEIDQKEKAIVQLNIANNLIQSFQHDFPTEITKSLHDCFIPKKNEIKANIKRLQK